MLGWVQSLHPWAPLSLQGCFQLLKLPSLGLELPCRERLSETEAKHGAGFPLLLSLPLIDPSLVPFGRSQHSGICW